MPSMKSLSRRPTALSALALALPALLAACSGSANSAETTPDVTSDVTPSLTLVAEGLAFPWAIAVLPDGDMLVTERDGQLRLISGGQLLDAPVSGLPDDIYAERQGGLLDIILHPDFAENRLVYLSYAQGNEDSNRTAIIRAQLSEDRSALEGVEEIFASHVPEKRGGAHFGSRLAFLPDGTLIATLGDGFRWMNEAQNTENHFGKIVRMTETGQPAEGNPFADQGGPAAYVWTYGHRNVQGLVYDAERGKLYAHEHGPMGGDELNLIEPGTNYGWPEITYGVNYDGSIITTRTEMDGMAQPLTHWVPSIAPSGMVVYRGEAYPAWQGDLLIGAMNGPAGQKLVRVDLDEAGNVVGREDIFADEAIPFRDVEIGADGHIYLATAELDGRIFRVDLAD